MKFGPLRLLAGALNGGEVDSCYFCDWHEEEGREGEKGHDCSLSRSR